MESWWRMAGDGICSVSDVGGRSMAQAMLEKEYGQ